MANKKIVYAEPGGYFPASVLKAIEKELGINQKPAAKKTVKKTSKTAKK